jgi:NAD(P)H dehydrogenase (quinone)
VKLLVAVASETGRTLRLAEALAEGARDAGGEVVLRVAAEVEERDLLEADAIVLGSGVHMGGMESSMRRLLERTAPLWLQGRLVGKLGAAFASAGLGARGGTELTLIALLSALAEHGLLLVPMHNRLEGFAKGGSHWGPVAWTTPRKGEAGPNADHLRAARAHGRHVAECARRWLRGAAGPAGGEPTPGAAGAREG